MGKLGQKFCSINLAIAIILSLSLVTMFCCIMEINTMGAFANEINSNLNNGSS